MSKKLPESALPNSLLIPTWRAQNNDSKPLAKNSYSKRPARKKPIELTLWKQDTRERHN
jgi:hypothetical protein